MQRYLATMCYEHENYVNDIERKKQYKKDIVSAIHKMKLPFLKKRKVLKLVQSLCDLQFLLDESEQTELMLNEEVWSSDCLEYNVNQVYEFILQNSIESQSVDTQVICKCCQVESDMDIKYIKMNDTLRKSKEDNPIIVLVNDMFVQPFVINGNHRIKKAFNSGIDKIEVYILDADNVNLLWSSFFVTLVAKKIVLINLCCRPCFIWGSITIITVWTNMIIINVCKFFYLLIECFLCCKLIQICAFILQGIEVTLHRCIVVRIPCFAHALCHIYRFAEFGKCFGRIL